MKKLSKTMIEHLQWMHGIQQSKTGRIKMKRPAYHENLRTHLALVRRGLVREDAVSCWLTEAGIAAASATAIFALKAPEEK